jgi:glycosyltransferase involved in cell wall biosynthesis
VKSANSNVRRLRIGIDAHAIGERKTGNERFISHVVRELQAICDHNLVLYFTDPVSAGLWRSDRVLVRVLRPKQPVLRIALALPIAARRDRLDVLLVQYTGPPILSCPLVTVVHDISFASHPEYFHWSQAAWMRLAIPWTMRRAARVVTVSDFSRAEIERRYGFYDDQIVVAYDGVDPAFAEPAELQSPVAPPFFLAVGNLQPRKNLETLIRAFALLKQRNPAIREKLVIVGQDFYQANGIRTLGDELVRSGAIVFAGYVDDPTLVSLLQAATAFAYPSAYEGFGLPVVEAMAAGVPVLVSDIPVMSEVAGDGALRVDAFDVPAWAVALERVTLDADLRRNLTDAGTRRSRDFPWRKCAETILDTLEAAVHGRAPASSGSSL